MKVHAVGSSHAYFKEYTLKLKQKKLVARVIPVCFWLSGDEEDVKIKDRLLVAGCHEEDCSTDISTNTNLKLECTVFFLGEVDDDLKERLL